MATQKKDFEKMWQNTKEQVYKLSKEAMDLLQKGEKEVTKASGKAKVNFETALLKLKREQLFHVIGKECYKLLKNKKGISPKVAKLIKEVKDFDRQISANKKLLRK
ncbi:MAG: hypothetical protein ABIA97_03535 [Candidatus Omnitrophota bacterium]